MQFYFLYETLKGRDFKISRATPHCAKGSGSSDKQAPFQGFRAWSCAFCQSISALTQEKKAPHPLKSSERTCTLDVLIYSGISVCPPLNTSDSSFSIVNPGFLSKTDLRFSITLCCTILETEQMRLFKGVGNLHCLERLSEIPSEENKLERAQIYLQIFQQKETSESQCCAFCRASSRARAWCRPSLER